MRWLVSNNEMEMRWLISNTGHSPSRANAGPISETLARHRAVAKQMPVYCLISKG